MSDTRSQDGLQNLDCLQAGRHFDPSNEDPVQDDARGEINQIKITETYIITDYATQTMTLHPLRMFSVLPPFFSLKRP